MKKRHLIILIITIVLVLCICAGLAFMFFFTDMFKSNKTVFSKYLAQNEEIIDLINDKDINSYVEKQKTTPYYQEGLIKTNVTFPDSSQSQIANALQNCSITFSGKVDNSNKYYSEIIKANYSDTQSTEFNIYQSNDIFAFKITDVLAKYIGMENNNLKEFAQKMQLSDDIIKSIPNKIEIDKLNKYTSIFSEEDKSNLQKKYLKIISDNLTDDMFSKEKSSESTVYSLKLNKSSIKNIKKKLLESLKDDEIIFNRIKENLINNYSLTEETVETYITEFKSQIQNSIDSDYSYIDNIDTMKNSFTSQTEDEPSNSNEDTILTIKVYTKNSNLSKTEFITRDFGTIILSKSNDMAKIELQKGDKQLASAYIQKIKSINETKYDIAYSLNNNQIFDLTTSFSGLNTNSVNEISELTFEMDLGNSSITNAKTKFITSYKKTKTFGEIQKEEIQNSDILLLNTAPSSKSIQNLFEKISDKIVEQNTNKLIAIGLKDGQNPFLYYLPSIANIGSVYIIQNPENTPFYSIPLVLTGISVSMLTGDNAILKKAQEQNSDIKTNRDQYLNQLNQDDSILDRASKSRIQTDLAEIKEKISLDISSETTEFLNKMYSKNTTSKNESKTRFEAIDKLLKNYKIDNDNFTYSYNNNKVIITYKNDTTYSATGTLSSNGNFNWDK